MYTFMGCLWVACGEELTHYFRTTSWLVMKTQYHKEAIAPLYTDSGGWPASLPYIHISVATQSGIHLDESVPMVQYWGPPKSVVN